MNNITLAERIASALAARQNCLKSGNTERAQRNYDTLAQIERNELPSGSGIDNGTWIDHDKSTAERIVLKVGFHHMDESGGYDGWTHHNVTVRASLISGIDIRISGRDRNGIKEYLHDVFHSCLQSVQS